MFLLSPRGDAFRVSACVSKYDNQFSDAIFLMRFANFYANKSREL